ncbi:DNA-3-methyladenine glycosylase 2 family protein [Nisaea acidiphila]|uniref:DNA-3-methyladenine glycosylase II n=1 Tax=Nisaea acidiphila TaxID=1862145 RepID=A0A9J7ART8_9PROT|nr:DNA-3-methyladenine glycosylase 2 family protein [Nisaea acidiphila]UUX49586.1 DNA-3-methyladenine glycosylase 2 family protein [Nisaea acidiphila]
MSGTEHDRALGEAVATVVARDPDLRAVYERLGPPPSRREAPGFAALIRILTAQQVSLASASAIWTRLNQILEVNPSAVATATDEVFREAGFSRPKVRYARALAEHVLSGRLDLEALAGDDDEAVRAALTAVPGIGNWTADIYLLFCLGRLDTWPGGDLAIQEALRDIKCLSERPNERQTCLIAEDWQPYRGAAAQLLWQHYRFLKFGDNSAENGVLPVTDGASR